jgi:DNA polymerase-3 subunit gamma/tau
VVNAVADKKFDVILEEIDNIVRSSKDISVFWQNLMSFYRDMLVYKSSKNSGKYLDLTDNELKQLAEITAKFSRETILAHCKMLEGALFAIQKSNAVKRTIAELTLVKMCDDTLEASRENLLSRISKLEDVIALGGVPTKPKVEAVNTEKKAPEPEKTQPKPVAAAAVNPAAPKLKGLSCWAEVLDRVSQSNSREASYLRQTRAFIVDGSAIKIYVPDSFTMMMIDGSGVKDSLRAALSMCLKREVGDSQLSFELAPSDLPDDNDAELDSIMENFEN